MNRENEINVLFEKMRKRYLDDHKTHLKRIAELAEDGLAKLEREDADGYYSMHHDIFRIAGRVYSTSYALGSIKRLEEDLKALINQVCSNDHASGGMNSVDPFSLPEEADVTRVIVSEE
jgi:hypothetical protein|tara:strand:+ start:87 stop:443 length:357 start_codon:yes stop_codon:yes gene_type:complete